MGQSRFIGAIVLWGALLASESPGLATEDAKATLSPEEFRLLTRSDIAYLQSAPAEPLSQLRKMRVSLFATAVSIAHNAQEQIRAGHGDAKQLATLRDAGLDVAELLLKKDYPKARERAATLAVEMKSAPTADPAPVSIRDRVYVDPYDLMMLFRAESRGGRDFEKQLREAANGRIREPERVRELAFQMVAVAELTLGHANEVRPAGRRIPETWKRFSEEMRQHAREAADFSQQDNLARTATAFGKVEASCVGCHRIFR